MATYCTPDDVRAALTPGGVSDGDQTAASLDDWQLEDAIDEAETVVNSYLTGYLLPFPLESYTEDNRDTPPVAVTFDAAPAPLRRWTRTIAAYLATLTFRRSKDLTDDDPIVRRYNMVIGLLSDVRAGLLVLDPELFPPATTSGQGVEIFNQYEGTLFGPEDFNLTPVGWHPATLRWYPEAGFP